MNPVIVHRKAKALLPTEVEELYSIRLKITQEGENNGHSHQDEQQSIHP